MKIILSTLFLLLSASILFADNKSNITIPDYSFTGSESSTEIIPAGYKIIDIDFAEPSQIDTYLQKTKLELDIDDKKGYNSEEPGFMYSSNVTTSVASLFVGEKAYKNNIVKSYLNKRYLDVINSFKKYEDSLKKSIYYDEARLLYALSLYETGSQRVAYNILSSMSVTDGLFKDIAMDSFFQLTDNSKRYDQMEAVAPNIDKFTPYSLSIWIKHLDRKQDYKTILSLLDRHKDYEVNYRSFLLARVVALYYLRQYKDIIAMMDTIKSTPVFPLAIDALILSGDINQAKKLVNSLTESSIKIVLETKIAIADGNLKVAENGLKNITNNDERVSLFFYAVSNFFDKLNPEFISKFSFSDKQQNDYVNYYLGLKYLDNKEYLLAVRYLSQVSFNKSLSNESSFYQGMAYTHLDAERAQYFFNKYIAQGDDAVKKKIAIFMVAQIDFINNRNTLALNKISNCNEDYCKVLRGDIYLANREFQRSINAVDNVSNDRAYLITATDYFNLAQYDNSIKYIEKMAVRTTEAEYILMMNYFKVDKVDDGLKIAVANSKNSDFLFAAVEQFILLGRDDEALKLLSNDNELSSKMLIEKAKLLMTKSKIKEAKDIYQTLLDKNELLFNVYDGLYQISELEMNAYDFLNDSYKDIEAKAKFTDEDKLLLYFTKQSLEKNNLRIARRYLALFNKLYRDVADKDMRLSALLLNAELNSRDDRFRDCLDNIDNAQKLVGTFTDEMKYIKATCLITSKRDEALNLFKELAVKDNRFYQLSIRNIVELSFDSNEILKYSEEVKPLSFAIYRDGMIKFMRIADNSEYLKHEALIKELSLSGNEEIRSYAMQRIGRYYFESREYAKSADYYMRAYYLFGNDGNKLEILSGAKDAYEALNDNASLKKINELMLKKM